MQQSTFPGTTWGRRKDDELCKGLHSRELQEWPWGRRERARRLLATLVGMRVTVALGSRLRGNDVEEAQGRRVMQRSTFAGTTWGRREDDELCKGLPSRERQEWPWGRRERARRLLATLVGIRVTVALGSRLPGNDVEEAQGRRVMQRSTFAGTTWGRRKGHELCRGLASRERREWPWGRRERARRLLATLVGIRVTVALGSRLPGNDVGEAQGRRVMQRSTFAGTTGVAVGTAGTGEEVVGDLGWYPSDGCAGFPPSRERRGGGARTTSYATVYLRGNDVGEAQGRRVMQRSPFAGTTGVAVGTAGAGEEVVGDFGWYASDGCAGFPPSRERRGGGARTTSYAKVYLRGNDMGEAPERRVGVDLRLPPVLRDYCASDLPPDFVSVARPVLVIP